MPLIDLPLEELYAYQGRNPRPTDHEAFWDAALKEMKAVDPQMQLTPVPHSTNFADCFHLNWTGVGGARLHAKLALPKNQAGVGPGLVKFHGYSIDSGDWIELMPYVAQGFTIAAIDVRGQGGLSNDPGGTSGNTLNGHIIRGLGDEPNKLFYRGVFLDCAQLAGLVMAMPNVDERRVGAFGWSQGGGLTLACAALEPRIARLAPVYPFLCDYQRVWEMDLDAAAYDELRAWFRRFDRQHLKHEETFTKLGYIDVQHLAHRITGTTLLITGLMDTICPPSTQFAAFNKVNAPKEALIYPDFTHEGLNDASDRIFDFFADL